MLALFLSSTKVISDVKIKSTIEHGDSVPECTLVWALCKVTSVVNRIFHDIVVMDETEKRPPNARHVVE